VAISPDRPAKLRESRAARSLGYALYSDSGMEAARAFGIAFQLDDETRAQYRGYGIDLADSAGEDHGQLPVPSVFLVDADREIRWVYSNPDYKVRPENEALLEAARRIARAERGGGDSSGSGDAGDAARETHPDDQ
jgi:peroxiredoxin